MSRQLLTPLFLLFGRRRTGAATRSRPVAPPVPADEAAAGCGWFDSSHELSHGLNVTEHASADAVAPELPLADWLGLHLAGWQADADGRMG